MSRKPKTFGPFVLERELGRGSNSVVYLAYRKGESTRYALKVHTKLDREGEIRMQLEAQITKRLNHPGIVRALEQGQVDGRPFTLLEYCEGESLDARLQEGRMPWREAVPLVLELASVLAFAHGKGVVHRDLKPANVMLEAYTQRPRLIDFGLARDPSLVRSLTQSNAVLGTPATMAPEQHLDSKVDARADVYALGVMLYMCLTGEPPFYSKDLFELQRRVCNEPPRPVRTLEPSCPPRVEAVIMQALAKKPEDRPADAGVFATALGMAFGEQSGRSRRAQPAEGGASLSTALHVSAVLAVLGLGLLLVVVSLRVGEPEEVPQVAPAASSLETSLEAVFDRARDGATLEALLAAVDALEGEVGDDPAGRARLDLARTRLMRRRGAYAQALKVAPIHASGAVGHDARLSVALCHLRQGRPDLAQSALETLNAVDVDGPYGSLARALLGVFVEDDWTSIERQLPGAPQELTEVRLLRAYGLGRSQRLEESLAMLEALSVEEPDDPHVHHMRAIVLAVNDRMEEALVANRRVLDLIAPRASQQSLYAMASNLFSLRRHEEALGFCQRLVDYDPGYARGHLLRGLVLEAMGRKQDADAAWREACRVRNPSTWSTDLSVFPPSLQKRVRELEQEAR